MRVERLIRIAERLQEAGLELLRLDQAARKNGIKASDWERAAGKLRRASGALNGLLGAERAPGNHTRRLR